MLIPFSREGLKDIAELKAVYQKKTEAQKEKSTTTPQQPLSAPSRQHIPQSAESTSDIKAAQSHGIKTLSSFIDIPKTLELPQKEIEYIWRLRHMQDPQSLCATVPQQVYRRIEDTARRYPQFILPLPREGSGAEIHFLQWTFPTPSTSTVLFTHLAEFKLRGEYAQPHTTITYHLDIVAEKGLVLLHGNVVEGRGVAVDEGKWLLMCLQKFYGGDNERIKLLEQFSQGNKAFKVEHLLNEAEKIV